MTDDSLARIERFNQTCGDGIVVERRQGDYTLHNKQGTDGLAKSS